MARKFITDQILKLYSKLGGNVSEVLGTRSNINFLGVGKSPEGFIDSTINIDAIGALGKNKVLEELKSSIGYLTADKLNDVQANKLLENMTKIDNVFNPKQIPNITDMATGTGELTPKGLAALRKSGDYMTDEGVMASETILPTSNLMGRIEGRMENIKGVSDELSKIKPMSVEEAFGVAKKGSNEIDALETMTKNRAGHEFITGFVDDVYKNAGATTSVDVPKKRAAAREFLNLMLKKETDLLPPGKGGTLESVVSAEDFKYITEGGGGALGDPLVLVKKYFGDEVARRLPLNSDRVIIEEFVDNVRFTKDKAGFATDDPRFNPDDLPEFKHGGLAKILEV